MTKNDMKYKALYRELPSNAADSVPEPQDYLGLNAAGFLLVALGHLTAAMRELHQEPPSEAQYKALVYTVEAGNFARYALALLDELKEETCES